MSRYKTQSADTSLATERVLVERYRTMSPADKVRIVRELSRASQELALAGIRQRHPEADATELRMRLAATRLDPDTMLTVFDWRRPDRER